MIENNKDLKYGESQHVKQTEGSLSKPGTPSTSENASEQTQKKDSYGELHEKQHKHETKIPIADNQIKNKGRREGETSLTKSNETPEINS